MLVQYFDPKSVSLARRRKYITHPEQDNTCLWDDILERPPCIAHMDRRTLSDLDTEVRIALCKDGPAYHD